uniref:coiled-coil domain-containing protein 34-like isoform X2 n=1 Tax=Doryrhamphus excisus TaxID=161450 RepID=UPI0025AE4860|nr:coiled-coil domain-containing protein 34-like isoform X2 [Doryrhamphus excisus]
MVTKPALFRCAVHHGKSPAVVCFTEGKALPFSIKSEQLNIKALKIPLVMSGWWLPSSPAFASEDFSSTPLKANERKHVHPAGDPGAIDVLPEDDDTFSLLSPIYHDSYESDEDDELSTTHQTSPKYTHQGSISSLRPDLWKAEHAQPEVLSAWEMWLVNKIKENQLRLKKKTDEERSRQERKEQEEAEREHKRRMEEQKIRDWQQMKREQERREQLAKSSRAEAAMRQRQEKQRETEQKAQQKYQAWLQKKNHERLEKAKKEKEKASLQEEQEKERRRRAEDNFKEWLAKHNEKCRTTPKGLRDPTGAWGYHPPPGFYNPIPWKPIHTPPPETSPESTARRKPQKDQRRHQYCGAAGQLRNAHR